MEFESRETLGVMMFVLGVFAEYIIIQMLDILKIPFLRAISSLKILDLLLIIIIVIGAIIVLINIFRNRRSKKETILEVYNYSSLPSTIDNFLKKAKAEIFFV